MLDKWCSDFSPQLHSQNPRAVRIMLGALQDYLPLPDKDSAFGQLNSCENATDKLLPEQVLLNRLAVLVNPDISEPPPADKPPPHPMRAVRLHKGLRKSLWEPGRRITKRNKDEFYRLSEDAVRCDWFVSHN